MRARVQALFGAASAFLDRSRRLRAVDLALLVAVGGAALGIVHLAKDWTGAYRPAIEIDLSLAALPGYTLLSLSRGLIAYALSLGFTLAYGAWAAKDRVAERVLIPLLDILQSIPVLGFMPGLVLALVAAFPRSNVGLELAAVVMIFTGQAWNMTFAYYRALRSVPAPLAEVGTLYRFGAWRRLRWIELPFAAIGLLWNSMMSMAGGWFFLMVSEAFVLGDHDFRLPGLGAYMSVAAARGDGRAMAASVAAMALLIVALDQLLWRPLVVWGQKFRLEEGGAAEEMRSWCYDLLRRSRLADWVHRRAGRHFLAPAHPAPASAARPRRAAALLSVALFAALLAALAWGGWAMVGLLRALAAPEWLALLADAALTLARVLAAVALGTLWTLPAGLAIGLSPRLSRVLQPVVQVVASFPAPMLFPAAVVALRAMGVSLGTGSVVLMLLGTQWYVLFNVVAGATAIPADLREAVRLFRFGSWQRFRALYFPAVYPHLVTGWVTAAGGAWNASIVSEYVTVGGGVLTARGLGSTISEAAAHGRFATLAAAVTVMALVVVAFNRLVWRRLHVLGEERFSVVR
ncbi:MAG TPA: ABC transporter permease subunit [Anaeromyxobacteraceae bacterium]|nr:ABC transporter permease subunit [Anaeromyxobacteraceae bacterium]